jgi:hypothetical protein
MRMQRQVRCRFVAKEPNHSRMCLQAARQRLERAPRTDHAFNDAISIEAVCQTKGMTSMSKAINFTALIFLAVLLIATKPNSAMAQSKAVPPCPGIAHAVINTDRASNGAPLPSCGGREVNGNIITTYKLVWYNGAWLKFGPSVKTVNIAPPPPNLIVHAGPTVGGPILNQSQISNLPQGRCLSGACQNQTVYFYQGNWYSLIASGGGNYSARLIASGGGNMIASGGGNIVSTNGGTAQIMLNAGANLDRYRAAVGLR